MRYILVVKNGLIYNGKKSRGLYILRDMPKTESTEREANVLISQSYLLPKCGKIASIMK